MSTILLFMISPICSCLYCLRRVCHGQCQFLIGIGACLALWSVYIPPIGDQSRYFQMIELGEFSFQEITDYNSVRLLALFFHQSGLSLELLRASIVFLSWLVLYPVFRDIILQHKAKMTFSDLFYLQIIAVSCFPWIAISYGFRWGAASCFLVAATYAFFVKK